MVPFEHWLYGVILLAACLSVHAFGLISLSRIFFLEKIHRIRKRSLLFATVTFSFATFYAACLHTLQACLWAIFYLKLQAFPNFFAAITYSLGAFTTFGSSGLIIKPEFILLSQTQAMNGVMAFGLTTAFLFSLVLRINPTFDK